MSVTQKSKTGNTFIISRVFEAPRDLVFKAWTETKRLARWSGPKGSSFRVARFELLPGGVLHSCVHSPDGQESWGKWVFREITPPESIVYVTSFSDEKGGLTRHPLSATWPLEMLTIVTFVERDGKTMVTLRWNPINATEEEIKTFENSFEGMKQGWEGSFDQLSAYLAAKE